MNFFEEFKLHINFVISPAHQKALGLAEMDFGLVYMLAIVCLNGKL